MAGTGKVGSLVRKFRKGKSGLGDIYEGGSAKAVSDEGAKEISIEELAQAKMREGKTSEQAYDEAERSVLQNVQGQQYSSEPIDVKGPLDRFRTGVDDDFNPVIPTSTKAAAAGTAAAGAGAAGMALQGDEVPFTEIKMGETPDKIVDKSNKDHEKDTKEAIKVADDEKTKIDKAIKKLLAGADAGASSYPMPGAYRPYKFNRTDFSEDLKDDLEDIGSKYETELAGLNDKEKEGKDRAAMKNILKGLIDAAALMYLAKHAPTAKYTGQTSQAEYDKELNRLNQHMSTQRSLVKEKFAELRAQTKARYRTAEKLEDQASQDEYRDYTGRQAHDKESLRAMQAMAKDQDRGDDKLRELQLKDLQSRRKQIMKSEAEGDKPSKPDITIKQQADLENKSKSAIKDFIIYSVDSNSETLAAELKNIGATDDEVETFIKAKEDGWIDSPEAALKYLPSSRELMQRQLSGIRGRPSESISTPSNVRMVAPDGRVLDVPAAKVSEMEAKGAKRE